MEHLPASLLFSLFPLGAWCIQQKLGRTAGALRCSYHVSIDDFVTSPLSGPAPYTEQPQSSFGLAARRGKGGRQEAARRVAPRIGLVVTTSSERHHVPSKMGIPTAIAGFLVAVYSSSLLPGMLTGMAGDGGASIDDVICQPASHHHEREPCLSKTNKEEQNQYLSLLTAHAAAHSLASHLRTFWFRSLFGSVLGSDA